MSAFNISVHLKKAIVLVTIVKNYIPYYMGDSLIGDKVKSCTFAKLLHSQNAVQLRFM